GSGCRHKPGYGRGRGWSLAENRLSLSFLPMLIARTVCLTLAVTEHPMHIGILISPAVTQLDATGPAQVLCRAPGATLHMVWKTLDPVKTDAGFSIVPTTTYKDCPQLDVICIPGGAGQIDLMNDAETLAFVANQGA